MDGIDIIVLAWVLAIVQLIRLRAWRGAAVCTWFGIGFVDIAGLISLGFIALPWQLEGPELPPMGLDSDQIMWALAAGVVIYILGLVLLVVSGRRGLRCVQACAALAGLGWLALAVYEPDRFDTSLFAVLLIAGDHFAIVVFAELARPAQPMASAPAYSDAFD